ncbi:MAG: 50S ribosomal protein L11, partial [Thermoguttaceae bacterium]|nr:50S ribosomal protein L11 [Thermoguttaceae bacterium]
DADGLRIPVVVKVYTDRSYDLETTSPHSVDLIKKAAGIDKGSQRVPKEKVGSVTVAQLEDIVKAKQKDLNAREVANAVRILAGTARSMGVDVVD